MPYCPKLYNHACIQLPGYYKPCCIYRLDPAIPPVWANDTSISEYKNSKFIKQIKKEMKTGWNKGCLKCYEDEKAGRTSQRLEKSNATGEQIQYIEISLSRECNLSCKMCNPDFSTKWETIYNKNDSIKEFLTMWPPTTDLNIEKIFNNLDILKLEKIKYLGGEPFISPITEKFIDFLDSKNIIQNIAFHTNTNCTFFPKKYIHKLKKFKTVKIGLSIDGFEKSTEYSRTGSSWNTIVETLDKWIELPNAKVNVTSTINALTVHDFKNLKTLCEEKNIHLSYFVLDTPHYLQLNALPPEYVESIKDSSNEIFFRNYTYNNVLFEKLKKFIQVSDEAQKINIRDYLPNLAKYLDK